MYIGGNVMKRFDFSMKLIVLAVCAAIAVNLFYTPKTDIVSAEDTEMRGIWVASVGNLDYPQSVSYTHLRAHET